MHKLRLLLSKHKLPSRLSDNHVSFFQPACFPIQGLISKLIGNCTVFTIEIGDESTPHLEVFDALGINTLIEPGEQLLERPRSERRIFLVGSALIRTLAHDFAARRSRFH